ncbi:MAG TPA: succinate:quinone oxidoreductase [Planctomycetales bacterium]|jgi:succinate dehydrogenase / fumarate reductase cytochrome b subunit|nr:succinate:quinone oxidoreductase [Planctomycetales bacterium]
MNSLLWPVRSTLASKYVMAVTGAGLMGFVIVHMLGNLQIFLGRQALNDYAHHLEEVPTLLWIARAGLLTIFIVHIVFGLRLWTLSRRARPVRYVYEDTVQASWASRHMLLTGLVILAFVIYHLLHFTFGLTDPKDYKYALDRYAVPMDPALHPELDVAEMVVRGFEKPLVSIAYVVAMIVLGLHLWHGAGSWLQSLGLKNKRTMLLIDGLGAAVAVLIVIGNCAIPLAILAGWRPS